MAVLSAISLDIASPSPGPINITVPAGALGAIVMCRENSGTVNLASSFHSGSWFDVMASAGYTCRLQYAAVSATGAQTITPTFGGGMSEGPVFCIAFVDGIDNSSFAAWVRDADCGETSALTVTSEPGDLVIGLDNWFTGFRPEPDVPPNETGWTSLDTQLFNNLAGRMRQANSPGASTTTITAQTGSGGEYSGLSLISIIQTGGPTPVTATTSASLAVLAARNAAVSLAAAVQSPQSISTSVATAVSAARTASTSLELAVQQALAAASMVHAAVQAPASAETGVTTAIRSLQSVSVDLGLAVQEARSASADVSLQVQAQFDAGTDVSLMIQAGASASASVNMAVQALRAATADLAVAVSEQNAAGFGIAAAVGETGTAGTAVSLQVQEDGSRVVAVQLAVQFASSAANALSAAIAELRSASVSLNAAISLRRAIGTAVAVSIFGSRMVACGVSLYVDDPSLEVEIDPRFIAKPEPRNWVARNSLRNWEAR